MAERRRRAQTNRDSGRIPRRAVSVPGETTFALPTLEPAIHARLTFIIRLVPSPLRADAVQVAWVAVAEGADPCRAVDTWRRQELRHRARNQTNHL